VKKLIQEEIKNILKTRNSIIRSRIFGLFVCCLEATKIKIHNIPDLYALLSEFFSTYTHFYFFLLFMWI
jgi:hypothetical protein